MSNEMMVSILGRLGFINGGIALVVLLVQGHGDLLNFALAFGAWCLALGGWIKEHGDEDGNNDVKDRETQDKISGVRKHPERYHRGL